MLQEIGLKYGTDKATYHYYLDFYETYLPKQIKHLLEIGVEYGNSLKMWKEFYGQESIIEGWDIYPRNVDGCIVKKIDQSNRLEIEENTKDCKYDIIIDDGGHQRSGIETSLSILFPKTKIYIVEDLHACTETIPSLLATWYSAYSKMDEAKYINKYKKVLGVYNRNNESISIILENLQNAWC